MDTQKNDGASADAGASVGVSDNTSNNKTIMAILAYLGILVIIPFLVEKKDAFVKFHIKQGAVLFVIEIVVWVLSTMLWQLWLVFNIVNLLTFILSIVGIVNVVQKREKELPVVGQFSKSFGF